MSSDARFTSDDLRCLLSGDVRLVERALALPNEELVALSLDLEEFVLRAEHVLRVLRDLRSGSITREQANRWGSFIYLDGGQWLPVDMPDWVQTERDLRRFVTKLADQNTEQEPARPLDAPYEAESEEAIIEAIAMLDSVADVDFSGENIDHRLDRLIKDLSRT